MNYKELIASMIIEHVDLDKEEIISLIEEPPNKEMGDYAFPCFKLAKTFRKAPNVIAIELRDKLNIDSNIFDRCEVVNAYINFYINASFLAKNILSKIYENKNQYGSNNEGKNKNIVIDYSSPNIAKPFHVGHLRSSVIGNALYNTYKFLGYNVTSVNHLGDYGTQFGKIIEGIKRWGSEYDLSTDSIDKLTEIYIRINALCEEDESVLEECRLNFKKIEEKDPEYIELWKKIVDLSLIEFNRIYDLLGISFDSYNGESFYSDKMGEVVDILNKNNKLELSNGAYVVDMKDINLDAPTIIVKQNGSSSYATRDLAAILYRSRTYDYDKCIYVTAYEQCNHFKQIFHIASYLDLDKKYVDGLIHVPFGMVRLKEGKLSTRKGNIIKLEDLLNESVSRAKKIIEEKNPLLENKDSVSKDVGIGAVIFNDLYNQRIKDEVFDWDILLNFQGETGPYVQYIYVRILSILNKANMNININNINYDIFNDKYSKDIINLLSKFNNILVSVTDNNEPSILARYLMELTQSFSSFYQANRIIGETEEVMNARLLLITCIKYVIESSASILGMNLPTKM